MKQLFRIFCLSLLLMVTGMAAAQSVAKIGNTEYGTLLEAIKAAETGATIELLENVDLSSAVTGKYRLPISKSLTINGKNHVIKIGGRGFGVGVDATSKIDVTFKNLTIKNTSSGARCIDTRGNIGSLTLDGVTLNTNGVSGGYTQPLTIGGNQADAATVIITNSTIQTNDAGTAYYAITTFNPVNMTISNSTLKGWACIYAKGADSSAGSARSTFTIDNSNIVSSNAYSGESNAFGAFMTEDNNVTIEVTNSEITLNNSGDQIQAIAAYPKDNTLTGNKVTLGEGNEVSFVEPGEFYFVANPGTAEFTITGGTFNANPSNYLAEGYKAVENNGKWTVQKKTYVAQIGEGEDVAKFESLEEAFKAAADGSTITLLTNVELTDRLFVNAGATPAYNNAEKRFATTTENKSVTLDLNGNNISSSSNIALAGGSLSIVNNGTADATHGVISTSSNGLAPIEIRGN